MTSGALSCFQYRQPRFLRGFRLELLTPGLPVQGRCLNLSETGLSAWLHHPIDALGPHTARLVLPTWTVDLEVALAYTDGCRAGFRFLFQSEQQRHFVRAIVHGAAWSLSTAAVPLAAW